ncbi:MAG: GNAT family N-acetyltransferase [Bacteroidota bacterium]
MSGDTIIVRLANAHDQGFVQHIITEIETASKIKGTGICKRDPALIIRKIAEGDAVIALTRTGTWVGFCYIQAHDNGRFVSSCALVVSPCFRGSGIATRIKEQILALAKNKYPTAKIFGLTTSPVVMQINSELGYEEVSYDAITQASSFWQSCRSCENYDILLRNDGKNCLCKAMVCKG